MSDTKLHDSFGREITYLRLSITDRCDFRCLYCMAEDMTFMPRKHVLTLEEIERLSRAFVDLGVKKIRVTGGEPLVRKDAPHLLQQLGQINGLDQLCLTTNGSQLSTMAPALHAAGVKRLNISIDSLNPERFRTLTRHGDLNTVLNGIEAARQCGFEKIKLNTVLMRHFNFDEVGKLTHFALSHDLDICFIEEMPLGEINSHQRHNEFISSEEVRQKLAPHFQLSPCNTRTGGPARYWQAKGYTSQVGFISPHSENFCASCNRIRVTASGKLLLCLGNEDSVDLKDIMRSNESDSALKNAIVNAMQFKPEKHHFDLHDAPQILRFMNTTGG